MSGQQLINLIESLSPEQQQLVEEFIVHLKKPLSFRTALDSFVREHSELLHQLAAN